MDFGFVDVLRDHSWPSEYFFRFSSALEVLLFISKIDLTLGITLDRSRDKSFSINVRPLEPTFELVRPRI